VRCISIEKLVGKVKNYLDRISVAIIELTDTLKKGDLVVFKKDGSEKHRQEAFSIQVERIPVDIAPAGKSAGFKVTAPVTEGDLIYVVEGEEVKSEPKTERLETKKKVIPIKKEKKSVTKPAVKKLKKAAKSPAKKKAAKKAVKKKNPKKAAKKSKKR